jgi:hypothetical protein
LNQKFVNDVILKSDEKSSHKDTKSQSYTK